MYNDGKGISKEESQEGAQIPVIEELIRTERDGTISFGNYKLKKKSKLQDFEHDGDLYKVKTYYEITKLECSGMFVYEFVQGTTVEHFTVSNDDVKFFVEGDKDAQLTIQLEDDTENTRCSWTMRKAGRRMTNMSGKLAVGVELNRKEPVSVKVVRRSTAQ